MIYALYNFNDFTIVTLQTAEPNYIKIILGYIAAVTLAAYNWNVIFIVSSLCFVVWKLFSSILGYGGLPDAVRNSQQGISFSECQLTGSNLSVWSGPKFWRGSNVPCVESIGWWGTFGHRLNRFYAVQAYNIGGLYKCFLLFLPHYHPRLISFLFLLFKTCIIFSWVV